MDFVVIVLSFAVAILLPVAIYFYLENKMLKTGISELKNVKSEFAKEFENISSRVVKIQKDDFDKNQRDSITSLLNPFKNEISEFKTRIETIHHDNVETKGAFNEQMKHLFESQKQISTDTNNLTNALKGDSKVRGLWGEKQLKNLLEITGLQEGFDYNTQSYMKNDKGDTIIADVIVKLPPDNRQIVIDAKVSLVDYEKYMNESDESLRANYLKAHLRSIRNHISELSSKSYADYLTANSVDFVFMFIPLEFAYMLALKEDKLIYENAYRSRIAIVTPSSLMPILRTIENLWRVDKGAKNAEQIADLGGKLYLFSENMGRVDDALVRAKSACSDAIGQLSTGKGNAFSIAEKMKKIGAKTTKNLSDNLHNHNSDLLIDLEDGDGLADD